MLRLRKRKHHYLVAGVMLCTMPVTLTNAAETGDASAGSAHPAERKHVRPPAGNKQPKRGQKQGATSASTPTAKGGTERITVTGNSHSYIVSQVSAIKIKANLRDIPQTIDVVPLRVMQDQNARSLADVLRNIAGIGYQTGDGQRDQETIRGFVNQGDFYIDGFRDDAQYFRDLSNYERVEVIKGPASVLYGRGSSGGFVNMITKKPGTEGGSVDFSYGSFNDVRGSGDFGHVFQNNNIAFRVTGAIESSDSYRAQQFIDRKTISPSLQWTTPDRRTSVLLQGSYLYDRRLADNGIPSWNGLPADVPRSAYYGAANARDADWAESQVWNTTVTIKHDFGNGIELSNAFRDYNFWLQRYGTIVQTEYTDPSSPHYGTYNPDHQDTHRDEHGWSNQLQLTVDARTGPFKHRFLVGLEISEQYKYQRRADHVFSDTYISIFNPVLPTYTAADANLSPGDLYTNTTGYFGTVGPFMQDMISLGSHWKALLGLRWDYFRQTTRPEAYPVQPTLARTDTSFSPRAGIVWQPTNTQSYYFSWTRSFQPAGESFDLAASNAALQPQETDNKEFGAKYNFFKNRLQMTLSLFDLRRSNINIPVIDGDTGHTVHKQVGLQRNRGFEWSARLNITDDWQAIASYAYYDTRYLKAGNTTSYGYAVEGKRLVTVPKNSMSFWITKSFVHARYGVGWGVRYMGSQWADAGNSVRIPSYLVFNTMAWATFNRFRAQINVDNLSNEKYIASAHGTSPYLLMPGAPLSASFNLVASF